MKNIETSEWRTRFSTELRQRAVICERCRHLYELYRERFDDQECHRTCVEENGARVIEITQLCLLCTFIHAVIKRENITSPTLRFEEIGSTRSLLDRAKDITTGSEVT